jgi:predicted transcriptional regulator
MEMYLAVIKVLDNADPMAQQQIMRKAGIPIAPTRDFFTFLVKLDIIDKKTFGAKDLYSLTEKGQRLRAYFGLDDDNPVFSGTGIFRID